MRRHHRWQPRGRYLSLQTTPYTDGDNGELEPACKNLDDAITQPAGANDFAPEVRVAEDATRKLKNVPAGNFPESSV